MVPDQELSEHFSLYDLTVTNRVEFQELNREVSPFQIQNLRYVAGMVEAADSILRGAFAEPFKIAIHSAYRCEALNIAIGSTDKSQHLRAEAVDFVPEGINLESAFRVLWREVKEGRLLVGQLIHETAERSYGPTSWIHLSLGTPWRPAEKCNQILRMEHGKYQFLETKQKEISDGRPTPIAG